MKLKRSLMIFTLVVGLCLAAGIGGAADIAWDMVASTDQNLTSYSTDAPDFGNAGDGFQKFQVGVSATIPYALVDDTNNGYPADTVGIIDSATDFDVFFGICDVYNDVNTEPVHATWVFDISSGVDYLQLHVDLAAMGDFELADPQADPPIVGDDFKLTYQVDGGGTTTFVTAYADEDGTMSYTMADGTVIDWDDPLVANGDELNNHFQTFTTYIPSGSQLTVTLTALTDGGSESFAVRDIVVTDGNAPPPVGGGAPIPTMSAVGIAVMILLLACAGVVLFRRRQ